MSLAEQWRAARPNVAGLHLDSGACSRQSFAVIDAAAQHARHEAEVGGYIAADAAAPVLDAGRAAVAALTGMTASDVVFTSGSNNALDILLTSWTGERTAACMPGEYGPHLAVMAVNGFQVSALPADDVGRLAVDDAARRLADDPPALVHLTPLASHRGSPSRWPSSPRCAAISACRWWSMPRRRWATSTARSAPPRSTARRANGWRDRAVLACCRIVPNSRSDSGPAAPPEWGLSYR